MVIITNSFAGYFALYLLTVVLDIIVWLNFHETATAFLYFINLIFKIPKNLLELLMMSVTGLRTLVLIISFMFFVKFIYDRFR